ncbi:hypothetical protein CVS47_00513 [Microbacterium lemovicicum]|uniref:DUF218 domain-containing protein n=1 Tax=Microbacterium lemovicicum TaxID=1072463 RepID=A0A3S9W787_9MICO|nr:YdcF family protein [Microbacterium lemovicicum]AZS35915.1 hypothetical protein CVS47_00513 [Microbacterium lemovicicum]
MRSRREWWAVITAAVLCVLAVVVAGLPVYVFPAEHRPDRADVIFIIGPITTARAQMAEQLRADGVSDRILVSIPAAGPQWAAKKLCRQDGVVCRHPEPFTTKGEAAMLSAYAQEEGLSTAAVITFTPHVARTRYIFGRCFPGETTVVGVDDPISPVGWIYQYAYQTAAFVKAAVTPCATLTDQ